MLHSIAEQHRQNGWKRAGHLVLRSITEKQQKKATRID